MTRSTCTVQTQFEQTIKFLIWLWH